MEISQIVQFIGIFASFLFLVILAWSAMRPDLRLWPPRSYSIATATLTWLGTGAIFGAAVWLGVSDWGSLELPVWLRFGPGLVAVIIGNLVVWPAAVGFGFSQTSGAPGTLQTHGLYRYSRNPQYVADMLMLAGWGLLSASVQALPVIVGGIAALIAASLAEESWLRKTYGESYCAYAKKTSRFFGLPARNEHE